MELRQSAERLPKVSSEAAARLINAVVNTETLYTDSEIANGPSLIRGRFGCRHTEKSTQGTVSICRDNDYDNARTALSGSLPYLVPIGCGTACDALQGSTLIRRADIASHRAERRVF